MIEIINVIQNHSIFTAHLSNLINKSAHGWVAWDGIWYISIVKDSYSFNGDLYMPSNVAFFPGFPLLVKIGSLFGLIDPVFVGLMLNVVMTFLTVFLIYKITLKLSIQKKVKADLAAKIATIVFLSFPASFFLAAFYAEALLALIFSASIYFALINRLFLSSLFILLGTASKSISVVLIPTVIFIDLFRHKNRSPILFINYIAICVIGSLGLIFYSLYLKINFSSFLLFNKIQIAWARQVSIHSIPNLWTYGYKNLFNPKFFDDHFLYYTSVLAMLLPALVLVVVIYFSLKYKTYWMMVLSLLIIIVPLSSGLIHSMNRYIMLVIPFFSICGILLSKVRLRYSIPIVVLSSILMLFSCFGFLTGTLFAG